MLDKTFNPTEAEPRLYKKWEDSGAFQPKMDTSLEAYSIVIPPPNVTGNLHMGHAVNNTIQDILIRFERMRGKDVLWQPGADHAGIATQMVVERKLATEGKARKEMGREEFLSHVWDWKKESGGNITQQLRRLGASCDWSREKFTLGNPEDPSDKMAEAVTKAFVEMYNDGLIYRDKRLVNWDPHFQSAISDLEVETKTVNGHYWHLRYPLADGVSYAHPIMDEDGNVTGHETRDYLVVATSRPETMLGDTCVAVHPDDERYTDLVGKEIILPIVNRRIPIIADEYPDPEKGSGAVKITPAHDFNDYEVGKRAGHTPISILNEKAEILPLEGIPQDLHGLPVKRARKNVVAYFERAGLLNHVEDLQIEQPVGDRSGVIIEPLLTDQWFVDTEKMAADAMDAVEDGRTEFFPANWKKTYDHWMNNIQPWCISRQLWWGHQIPAWYGPSISKDPISSMNHYYDFDNPIIFCAATEEELHKNAFEYYSNIKMPDGTPAIGGGTNIVPDRATAIKYCNDPDGAGMYYIQLYRDPDVLDTWFSSGLWPFSTMGWPEQTPELERFYPGSVLVTAFDIIFFWVARMMMQGLHFMGDVPFKQVYIHALVLDEQGKKMSKSIGNTIDPLDLIDGIDIEGLVEKRTRGLKNPDKAPQVAKATRKAYPDGFEAFGADALRFTLAAMAGMGRDIKLSVERIAGYRNFGTKLWSAANFGQMNACQPQADFDPASVDLALNKWIISETVKTSAEVTRCLEAYRFNDAADAAYKFAWDTFCAWYLELSKPILSGEDAGQKSETQATFAWVLDQILKLLHPFMPFITEELWGKIGEGRDEMLILTAWPDLSDSLIQEAASADIDWLQTLIGNIRSVRADMNIPPSKKAPLLMLADKLDPRLAAYAEQLSPMARVEHVELADTAPRGALQTVVDGVTYAIPLEGLIDLGEERARLAKEIEKIEAEIAKIDKKLSNPNFTDKAPPNVVQIQHDRKTAFVEEKLKLEEALGDIA
ncbi:MAG: valine--tRNA ligase [Maricaulaceae bacterium]